MTTMKTRALLFGIALGAIALSSCSNDDNTKDQKEETQGVRFTITEEGFGADTELTRATPSTQPQIIEAGDCEAEISIERAPAEKLVATRGVTTPVHYTIRAYHNGTLRGEMKGTFTPTGFTPDAGYSAQMELGRNRTYDFVCFNDKVTPNGNNLDVTLANAKDARIGRQSIAIGTTDQTINLSSKHVGCRVQTQVVAKKNFPTPLTSTIESIGATIPQTVSYNPATNTYTTTATTAMPATANNSPATAGFDPEDNRSYYPSWFGMNYGFISASDYHYFLPGTDVVNLKLNNLSGTIFWKPFNMNIAKLSTTSKPLEANGSYAAKIRMKANFTYLFSDGTTGFFRESTQGGGTKTAVAIVVDATKRMAMALNDADNGNQHEFSPIDTSTPDIIITPHDDDGEKLTWDGTTSYDGHTVKANEPTRYPAFYHAAHYTPTLPTGVSITGTLVGKRWFLPSNTDWKSNLSLNFTDPSLVISRPAYCFGAIINEALTQVGGKEMEDRYTTSTELFEGWGHSNHLTGMFRHDYGQYIYITDQYKNNTNKIRAFIHY